MHIKEITDEKKLNDILTIVRSMYFNSKEYTEWFDDGNDSCEYSRRMLSRLIALSKDLSGELKEYME